MSKPKDEYVFDLIGNAKDSLEHAVEHFSTNYEPSPSDLKRSILDVTHVVELLLKERLKRVSPALIWKDVDRFPDEDKFTVDITIAKKRLEKIVGITFSKEQNDRIESARKLRNRITHYQFVIEKEAAKGIVGGMLSFIFVFSKKHLNLDWEEEFRPDDRWESLVSIYEFCQAHVDTVRKRIHEENGHIIECPQCGWETYDVYGDVCRLCGHHAYVEECDSCGEYVPESFMHQVEKLVEDTEEGRYSTIVDVCGSCWNDHAEGLPLKSNKLYFLKRTEPGSK